MGKGNRQKARSGDELHSAARSGDLVAVQIILSSNPFFVNSRDKHSRTPLHLAAFAGHAEVVSYLCKNKANAGASAMDDMTAIHFAAQKGHLEVVRALVSAGASVKSSTRKGMTPLHYAAEGSHLELVKYLAKKGASLSAKTRAGKTPLDLATNEDVHSFLEEFEKLAKNGIASNKDKAEQSDPKTSTSGSEDKLGAEPPAEDKLGAEPPAEDKLGAEPPAAAVDEENDDQEKREANEDEGNGDREKRKADEDDAREGSSQSKKAKVKLSHLQGSDDVEEEDM